MRTGAAGPAGRDGQSNGQEHGESPIRIAQPAGTEHATELQTTNTKEMAHEGR